MTEHAGRILCSVCLDRTSRPDAVRPRRFRPWPWLAGATGIAALWFAVHLAGRLLLTIPTEVHDGAIWKSSAGWSVE